MKIENQVCTLEQAKTLKKLGVSQEAMFSWCGDENHIIKEENKLWVWVSPTEPANSQEEEHRSMVPSAKPFAAAYTLAELGEMLNSETYTLRIGSEESEYANWSWYDESENIGMGPFDTEAQARAGMLIHFLEKGRQTIEETNERLLNS